MEREQLEARAALAAIAGQRREAAERLVTPWWYHPLLGILIGGLIAAQAGPTALKVAVLPVFFIGLAALVSAYQHVTGVWVGGLRRGPAGRVTIALVAVYLAALAVSVILGGWAAIAAGIVVVVATVVLGHRFDRALREELAG
jgi:hypothetical protein